MPIGLPLQKDNTKSDVHNTIKKDLGVGAQKVPGPASSSPGKEVRPKKPALRTEKVSSMKPAGHYSLPEAKTASNFTELPVKQRRPYLQMLVARDLTPPGVPASNLPQVVNPASPICDSKAARVLQRLHHQDPGGTRMKSASVARPERDEFIHSTAEAQETHRAPPFAASHGATKSHLDPLPKYLSVQRPACYFQAANPQQIRTLWGTGKGSLKPSTNPKMAKHATQKSFQEVDLRHHPRVMTMEGPGERVQPSAAK